MASRAVLTCQAMAAMGCRPLDSLPLFLPAKAFVVEITLNGTPLAYTHSTALPGTTVVAEPLTRPSQPWPRDRVLPARRPRRARERAVADRSARFDGGDTCLCG